MNFKKRYLALFFVGIFLIGLSGAYAGLKIFQTESNGNNLVLTDQTGSTEFEVPKDMQKVTQAYGLIKKHYIENVEDNELIEGAIQGMLDTLEDPYSTYMDEEAMERFDEQIKSSFQGIGAEVSMVEGKVTIVAPIKDSPAEKAGLRPNDQILKVDDEKLEGLDLNKAVEKIRGEKGSEVTLDVQRAGTKNPFKVKLIRDDIPLETVYSEIEKIEGKDTGVIQITSFSETTAGEFTEQLKELEEKGIEGLVIDVRGNPGGLLDSVEDILKLFVPNNIPYIQIENQQGEKDLLYTDLDKKKSYPINVIIDEGSASASEILAVSMKEIGYDVIGTTSFGKGTVQQAVPLGDGGMVKLTFYKWLSPEGNWINEVGVEPTIEVSQPDYFYANPIQLDDKPLTFNTTGEQIENAQMMLSGLGYDTGRVDGYFDQKTKAAVEQFQKDNKLEVNGKIDEETAGVIATSVIEVIRSGDEDNQLRKAEETLYKK